MKILVASLSVAAILLSPATGLAAEGDPSASSDPAVSVPNNGAVLQSVIAAVAATSHKQFLVSPHVQGTINLGTLRLRDIDYPTLLAVLSLNGYAAAETPSGVLITADSNARQLPTRMYSPKSISAPDAEWVTVIMPVKSISAA